MTDEKRLIILTLSAILVGVNVGLGLKFISAYSHRTEVYEQRELAKINVELINTAGRLCKNYAEYNIFTGFMSCEE